MMWPNELNMPLVLCHSLHNNKYLINDPVHNLESNLDKCFSFENGIFFSKLVTINALGLALEYISSQN